jgi:hypothetical protein
VTEAEWLASRDLAAMVEAVGELWLYRLSGRKMRLVACAATRRVWHLLTRKESRRAVTVAERDAEGRSSADEVHDALMAADEAAGDLSDMIHVAELVGDAGRLVVARARCAAASAAAAACSDGTVDGTAFDALEEALSALREEKTKGAEAAMCALFREVFGSPSRTVAGDVPWRTPPVLRLARAASKERELPGGELDAARLAVLADALEEAGCSDRAVLKHLRGAGPHCRGCWALDEVLAKE